jgi:UDP-3-O-[3-hydroxymyristoyl] glucosamine N-acyltransferase
MIYRSSDKPLAVVSYDTATFSMLTAFMSTDSTESVTRIDPEDFLKSPSNQYQYINIVVKDFDLRKQISKTLDQHNLGRWTFIAEDPALVNQVVVNKNKKLSVGQGCVIYPGVWAYSGTIGNDVLIHSGVKLAENVSIGNGCYLSGATTIAGNCKIGDWCFLGNNLFFIDNVSVCDNVKLLPGTNLRKSITQPGTYYNPHTYKIEKIVV